MQALNLAPDALNEFRAAWKMQPGDLYDSTYLITFLKKNVAQPYLRPYTPSYKIERDPETHMVTVIFTFGRVAR